MNKFGRRLNQDGCDVTIVREVVTGQYLGFTVGVIGGVLGGAIGGIEWGLLGVLFGYFIGKSAQSMIWTVTGGRTS
jgi:hypothetical protein